MRRLLTVAFLALAPVHPLAAQAQLWLTTADGARRLERQADLADDPVAQDATSIVITIDPARHFQSITGFGAAMTDASAILLQERLNAGQRKALLRELFGRGQNELGLSLTRIAVGASDFSRTHYSYDDMPPGVGDPSLKAFSIAPARRHLLPSLKDARRINPGLKILAAPWSAPAWMKTSDSLVTGRLKPEYYGAFAAYLHRFIRDFGRAGAPIHAIALQNEPHFEPADYPGMRMEPSERAAVIGAHLGPLLRRTRTATRILDWDHNWDQPHAPLAVLSDPKARPFIAGIAWHCYAGDVSAQSPVHDAFPDKESWMTECAGGGWEPDFGKVLGWMTQSLIIGTTRNWSTGVILWNIALDENGGPHKGGCGNCRGVVTISSVDGSVTRNVEYYVLGHASRFVRPGSLRIASDSSANGVETAAFLNPDGRTIAVIAHNSAPENRTIVLRSPMHTYRTALPAGAVVTIVWSEKDKSRSHK